MKKTLFLLIGVTFLFSSCGVHSGLTSNLNHHTTDVVLSKNNFKVIKSFQGESQTFYIFGIGGFSKNAMIAEAKADMMSRANIIGRSRAIINETVEIKRTFFLPFYGKYKVIASGHIVEFTE